MNEYVSVETSAELEFIRNQNKVLQQENEELRNMQNEIILSG